MYVWCVFVCMRMNVYVKMYVCVCECVIVELEYCCLSAGSSTIVELACMTCVQAAMCALLFKSVWHTGAIVHPPAPPPTLVGSLRGYEVLNAPDHA